MSAKGLGEWLDDRGGGVRPPAEAGNFCLFQTDQIKHMRSTELYIQDRGYLPGVSRVGREADSSCLVTSLQLSGAVSVAPTHIQCVDRDNLDYTEFIASIKLAIKMNILCN